MDVNRIQQIRSAAASVFEGRGIVAAYAFGSRVAGRPLPESDLDIGYYLLRHRQGKGFPLRDEMRLAADLSDRLGVEVDLRSLANAPLELRGRVLEEGVRIYSGDDAERVALERYLLSRYHDYKEIFRRMHEVRLKRIASAGL